MLQRQREGHAAATPEPVVVQERYGLLPDLPSAPRLRIAHILLWMACVAVDLAVLRLAPGGVDSMGARVQAMTVASSLAPSLGLAALVILPFWRRAGYRFPTPGGEWLLIICGLYGVYGALSVLTYRAIVGSEQPANLHSATITRIIEAHAVIMGGIMTIAAALAWMAFARLKWRTAWRCLFFVLASLMTLYALSAGLELIKQRHFFDFGPPRVIMRAVQYCVPVALVIAILRDLFTRRRLPWTHWLGAAAFAAHIGIIVVEALLRSRVVVKEL